MRLSALSKKALRKGKIKMVIASTARASAAEAVASEGASGEEAGDHSDMDES